MEQPPRGAEEGGDQALPERRVVWFELEPARREELIDEGIEVATAENAEIEDWIARHIALRLSERRGSALDVFARTGEVTTDLQYELVRDYAQQPARRQRWIDRLGTYAVHRDNGGPVAGWSEHAAVRDRFDAAWRATRPWAVRAIESRRCDIEAARARDAQQPITNELAMRMLVMLASGPHSAIARFVADGKVTDALSSELADRYEQGGSRAQGWIDLLGPWIVAKTGVSPNPGRWPVFQTQEQSSGQPEVGEDNPVDDHGTEDRSGDEAADSSGQSDRLAGLEERLAPLPDLGDIPRPPVEPLSVFLSDGYEWMEHLPPGWHAEPSWGRDGWDLGAWPIIVVALFVDEECERYALATYTEGDVTVKRYASRGALYVAVNEIAEFHWRLGQSLGPDDLPANKGLLAKHCGPYSEDRYAQEADERPDTGQTT